MAELRFTEQHEWVRIEGDVATVGITEFAQEQLGDVVYVELPAVGAKVEQFGETGVVESVKAASEIYAPVSGEVVAVNEALNDEPGTVNSDPLGKGWFMKIRIAKPDQVEGLLVESAYKSLIEEQS